MRRRNQVKRWLKSELHSHCSLDPVDYRMCLYSPERLIVEAANLGYDVLAITCHDLDVWTEDLSRYAGNLGITLIPGMEVTTEATRHVLAYNFLTSSEHLNTMAKIRAHSREDTLVIAPHPFFPGRTCLRHFLRHNLDIFDAFEYSGFHIRGLDFNRRSRSMAAQSRKPLVGNGDIHCLWQLGRTFSWIYSEPGVQAVLSAVKKGLVRIESTPLSFAEAATWWATALRRYLFPINSTPGHIHNHALDKVEYG